MTITEALETILGARYGREVRQAIHDGIKQAYEDAIKNGNANMEVSQARGSYPTLAERLKYLMKEIDKRMAKGEATLADIDWSVAKIDETHLTETLIKQIAGTANVSMIPADGSIGFEKLSFAEVVSSNKFDKTKAQVGALSSTGELVSSSTNFYTSNFIPVKPNDEIKTSATLQAYSYYDSGQKHITNVNNAATNTLTVPEGVVFVKVTFYKTNIDTFMLTVNADLPSVYEPFKMALKIDDFGSINGTAINDGTVDETKLAFLQLTGNRLDHTKSTVGQYLNEGVLSPHSDYSTSDFYPVKAGDRVGVSTYRTASFFDNSKTAIENFSDGAYPSDVYFTAKQDGYFRFSYKTSDSATTKMVVNEELNEVNRNGYKTSNIYIPKENIIGLTPEINTKVELAIPSKVYVTKDEPLNIQHINTIKYLDDDYDFEFSGTKVAQYQDYTKLLADTTGTTSLTAKVFDRGNLLDSVSLQSIVSAKRATPIRVLVIGDSTVRATDNGYITQNLLDYYGTNITLLGTMGTGTNKWEGRSGWTANYYRQAKEFNGVINPFYNPSTKDFDINYYLTQTGQVKPDVVIVRLGINDVFNFTNDSALNGALDGIIGNFKAIVQNIQSNNIKVAIDLPSPPNFYQQKFGEQAEFGTIKQTNWRAKMNIHAMVKRLIEEFDGSYDLIPSYLTLNSKENIQDHIHPTEVGYGQLASEYIAYINSLV